MTHMEQPSILLEESHRSLTNEDILFYLYESDFETGEEQEQGEYELLHSEAEEELLQTSLHEWDMMFVLHEAEEMETDD